MRTARYAVHAFAINFGAGAGKAVGLGVGLACVAGLASKACVKAKKNLDDVIAARDESDKDVVNDHPAPEEPNEK